MAGKAEQVNQADQKPENKPNDNLNPNGNDTAQKTQTAFDWVTQRSQCSLPKIFKTLRQEVEADVKTRNALRPQNSPYEFSVVENGADFSAVLTTKEARASVAFSLAEHAIVVRDDQGNLKFEVTLTFNDEGECKLYVNDEERKPWQVRRMGLEELMFKGY